MSLENLHPFWQVFLVAFKHPVISLMITFVLSLMMSFLVHLCLRALGRTLPGGMALDENPRDRLWVELWLFVRNSVIIIFYFPEMIPEIIGVYLLILLVAFLSVFLWLPVITFLIVVIGYTLFDCWRWDRWEKRHFQLSQSP